MSFTPDVYRSAILTSLANISDFQSGKAATTKEVISKVSDLLGVEHDPKSDKGKDLGLRVNNAFRSMTEKAQNPRTALCQYLSRGYWSLTDAGIEAARSLQRSPDQQIPLLSRKLPSLRQMTVLAGLLGKKKEVVGRPKSAILPILQKELERRNENSDFLYDQSLMKKHLKALQGQSDSDEETSPEPAETAPAQVAEKSVKPEDFPPSPSIMTEEELDVALEEAQVSPSETKGHILVNKDELQALVWDSYLQGKRDAEQQSQALSEDNKQVLGTVLSFASSALASFQEQLNSLASALQIQIPTPDPKNEETVPEVSKEETHPSIEEIKETVKVEASEEEPPQDPEENETGRFLRENFTELYPYLERYLTQKLPRSAEQDEVPDHIQTYLEKAVRRNAWAKEIQERGSIPFSKIAYFCKRSAISDIRGWGKDGCCKAMKGALTETERKKLKENPEPETYSFAHLRYDQSSIQWTGDEDSDIHFSDATGGDLREEILMEQSQEDLFQRCEEIIRQNVKNEQGAYIHAMWGLASNMTAKEIAESLGMDANRGTAVVSDLKRLLKKARKMGRFSDLVVSS